MGRSTNEAVISSVKNLLKVAETEIDMVLKRVNWQDVIDALNKSRITAKDKELAKITAELSVRWIGVDNQKAKSLAMEAISLADRHSAPYSEAVARSALGMIYGTFHGFYQTKDAIEQHALAISLFRENGYVLHEAAVYTQMISSPTGLSSFDTGAHFVNQIEELLSNYSWKSEPDGDGLPPVYGEKTPKQLYSFIQTFTLIQMGSLSFLQKNFEDAIYNLLNAWKYTLEADYPWLVVVILTIVGQSLQGYGEIGLAEQIFNKQIDIINKLGITQYLPHCNAYKLELLVEVGRLDEVKEMVGFLSDSLKSSLNDDSNTSFVYSAKAIKALVRAYISLGNLENAQFWLDKIIGKRDMLPFVGNELLFLQGEIYLQTGYIEKARTFFTQAYHEGKEATAAVFQQKLLEQQQFFNVRLAREEAEKNYLKTVELKKILLNALPERVVGDLQNYGCSKPELFSNVSVMFTDFVGFTEKASTFTPVELIEEMSELFSHFDEIINKRGCERIKTIGDGYMAVCGVPESRDDHAIRLVEAGLEIIKYIKNREKNNWQIRVGIHSGSVTGGIVGISKYAYDIFGDTINVASRMESHSVPMKLNISESTYQLLSSTEIIKPTFSFTPRGGVTVKGKGQMNMWFVEDVI